MDPTYGMPRYNLARAYALQVDLQQALARFTELEVLGRPQRERFCHARLDPSFAEIALEPAFEALFSAELKAECARLQAGNEDKGT
jgi:hypothetical protein